MRILLVNKFHWLKGGSEKYYFELGQLLKEHGHEVAFFSMKNEKNIHTGEKEYFVDEIDLNTGSKLKALDVIYSKANYRKMIEAIEDFKPDIVHLNNFQRQLSASIVKACNDKKVPVVFTAHDMNAICPASAMLYKGKICEDCLVNGYKSCIKKNCIKDSKLKSLIGVLEKKYYDINNIYEKIDCIISPSHFIKQQLVKGKIKFKKIEVLHNFVLDTNTKYKKDNGYAFYFGRLSIEKGILNLIKAFKISDCEKLLIAGDGPEKENIEKYIKENNLKGKVELLGYLKQDEIRKYIKEAKFIVVPSIWYENCPYSILETLEIGKPVIGSNIGGISELIKDNINGSLYEYDNINQLANKIKNLFYETDLIERYSRESRKLYEENYSSEVYYEKLLKIYKTLIVEKENV